MNEASPQEQEEDERALESVFDGLTSSNELQSVVVL